MNIVIDFINAYKFGGRTLPPNSPKWEMAIP